MRKFAAITAFILLAPLLTILPTTAQPVQPSATAEAQPPVLVAPEMFDTATAALEVEDFDSAILNMSLFLLLNPTYSQGYYIRALAYLGLQNTENALVDIEQALSTSNSFPEYEAAVYALRANIFAQDPSRYEEALADYTAAIELSPSGGLYRNRALLYLSTADLENALADFNIAVDGAPDDALLRIYRAYTNNALDNLDDAAQDYYQFLELIETRRIQNGELTSGEAETVTISEGVIHEFEFEGEADQVVTIMTTINRGDAIDPLLVLLDEDGDVIAANDDFGATSNAAIVDYVLPAAGTYTVVLGHSLGGSEGRVTIVYEITK